MAATDDVATTVVAVNASHLPEATHAIPTALVDIAKRHELVIVCGRATDSFGSQQLIQAIRALLPRWRVTAALVDPPPLLTDTDVELVDALLNEGALAMAVTSAADPGPTAEALAIRLRADHALRLVYHPVEGAQLHDLAQPPTPLATSGAS